MNIFAEGWKRGAVALHLLLPLAARPASTYR